jgi:hypothetical protein
MEHSRFKEPSSEYAVCDKNNDPYSCTFAIAVEGEGKTCAEFCESATPPMRCIDGWKMDGAAANCTKNVDDGSFGCNFENDDSICQCETDAANGGVHATSTITDVGGATTLTVEFKVPLERIGTVGGTDSTLQLVGATTTSAVVESFQVLLRDRKDSDSKPKFPLNPWSSTSDSITALTFELPRREEPMPGVVMVDLEKEGRVDRNTPPGAPVWASTTQGLAPELVLTQTAVAAAPAHVAWLCEMEAAGCSTPEKSLCQRFVVESHNEVDAEGRQTAEFCSPVTPRTLPRMAAALGGNASTVHVRVIRVTTTRYDHHYQARFYSKVGCAFFESNLHSRMPLVPTPARLKRAGV